MPWILLLLAALFTAPLSAATLPGVPTANTDKNSASEPDVEQKRAAYAALADVLANDSARQELIDQLRKAAATPPPDSTPTLTPPAVKEETTVLEDGTEIR
ncbi:mechanosensitive channel protein, partial [Klebsiella pneumoniae]